MHEVRDERGVPVSHGIPPAVRVIFGIGLFLVLSVGGMVIGGSRFGHVWPSSRVTAVHLEGPLDLGGTAPVAPDAVSPSEKK